MATLVIKKIKVFDHEGTLKNVNKGGTVESSKVFSSLSLRINGRMGVERLFILYGSFYSN